MPDLNEMYTIEILSITQENPRVSGNQWERKSDVTARKRERLNGKKWINFSFNERQGGASFRGQNFEE